MDLSAAFFGPDAFAFGLPPLDSEPALATRDAREPATATSDDAWRPAGLTIRASGLAKSFGPNPVLRGVDLMIPAGQFVAIVGRSGCGKSTLLRLAVGLDRPSAGSVALGETAAQGASRIMFQEPRLLPWATVADNVAVGLGRSVRARERFERARTALARVGLADKAGVWPATLSGGQRQRVALARALVSRPRFLALDEPLGALDALTRIDMQGLIERVWADEGFTALLVTHDVAEAVALADRILVLEEGRVALDVLVDLPRPRRRGDPRLAALEGRILDRLLGRGRAGADHPAILAAA